MLFIPELCSGSTADFESVSISSILISGAILKHTRLNSGSPVIAMLLYQVCFNMEDDGGEMVRRLALKTRFSEMGWGSTPPSSANFLKELLCRMKKKK